MAFGDGIASDWQGLLDNARQWQIDIDKFSRLEGDFLSTAPEFFLHCARRFREDFPLSEVEARFPAGQLERFLLLCVVANYGNFENYYQRAGLPQEMFQAIRGDLKIWLDTLEKDLGFYGLTPRIFGWQRSCVTGRVKQIGRLQFNDIHCFEPECSVYLKSGGTLEVLPANNPGNPPSPLISHRDPAVNLHIPASASGALNIEACRASLARIRDFMTEFHPDYDYQALVCYSWLLDPQFQTLLSAHSNIVQFQKLGPIFTQPLDDLNEEVVWRIWGAAGRALPYEQLPRYNTMTRKVAEFLESGGKFRVGIMVIPR